MAYSTLKLASNAYNDLNNALIKGLKVNNLDNYVSKQLRNDFIRDEKYIRNSLNAATNKAFDATRAQAIEDALSAENVSYANTRNALAELRKSLIGSGSSGANIGAANATALQALLGLGQSNSQTTTEGLRNINNVSRERAATLAQNAVDAINTANDATNKMYDAATSAYNADRSYGAQGAAQALGELAAAADTAASAERQTSETNTANKAMNERTAKATENAAKYGQNQNIKYSGSYTVKS